MNLNQENQSKMDKKRRKEGALQHVNRTNSSRWEQPPNSTSFMTSSNSPTSALRKKWRPTAAVPSPQSFQLKKKRKKKKVKSNKEIRDEMESKPFECNKQRCDDVLILSCFYLWIFLIDFQSVLRDWRHFHCDWTIRNGTSDRSTTNEDGIFRQTRLLPAHFGCCSAVLPKKSIEIIKQWLHYVFFFLGFGLNFRLWILAPCLNFECQ